MMCSGPPLRAAASPRLLPSAAFLLLPHRCSATLLHRLAAAGTSCCLALRKQETREGANFAPPCAHGVPRHFFHWGGPLGPTPSARLGTCLPKRRSLHEERTFFVSIQDSFLSGMSVFPHMGEMVQCNDETLILPSYSIFGVVNKKKLHFLFPSHASFRSVSISTYAY